MKRLLTIGHSYVVAQNRRLAHEMALAGDGDWEVTAAAPEALDGDLRRITLEPIAGEACRVVPLPMRRGRMAHLRAYGELGPLLREPWDVVHCWEEPYVWAGWQIARSAPRSARFVFATFQNISKSYPFPFSWMEQSVVRRADGWIAFGETVREALIDRPGYEQRPWRVITPGVDVTRFTRDAAGTMPVRRLADVRVNNIAETIQLFELQADPADGWLELARAYEEALGEFESRRFERASGLLGRILGHQPTAGPPLVQLSRSRSPPARGPGADQPGWGLPAK